MILEMEPLPTTFMDTDNSRSYMDDLYSSDVSRCYSSVVRIKNAVIGSNRRKESVIAQGLVPRLLQLVGDESVDVAIRVEAAITIGSLAKGRQEHTAALHTLGAVEVLLKVLCNRDERLLDACLCSLRTLMQIDGGISENSNSKGDEVKMVNPYTQEVFEMIVQAAVNTTLHRQYCVASILAKACRTVADQNALCAVRAPSILAALLAKRPNSSVCVPLLSCFAAIAYNNASAAAHVANTVVEGVEDINRVGGVEISVSGAGTSTSGGVLTLSTFFGYLMCRDQAVEVQLEAARCLTNLHRAGALAHNDPAVTYKTLPCLVRLCLGNHLEKHRAYAADTLAYLIEVNSELQQLAAISNQLVQALINLVSCRSVAARQAAFRAFASLAANDEGIRHRIISVDGFIGTVLLALKDSNEEVNLAVLRFLLSLSRSVQLLRTTFQDHCLWKPIMKLLTGSPSTEMLMAVSSILCNLLLEFSPAKESLLEQGTVELLTMLTIRPEASLRLNGVWALMNLTFQSEQHIKTEILNVLGRDQVFRLLVDPDTRVMMKMLGLLRNLVSPKAHTDTIMQVHGVLIMQGVVLVLEGSHGPDVKEQALCILCNIADGDRAREHILNNEDVLKKVVGYMTRPVQSLQEASICCVQNMARHIPGELPAVHADRLARLRQMNVVNLLQQILTTTTDSSVYSRVKSALNQFGDV